MARVAPNYVLHVAYILFDRRHVGPVVPLTNNAGSRRDYCGGIGRGRRLQGGVCEQLKCYTCTLFL